MKLQELDLSLQSKILRVLQERELCGLAEMNGLKWMRLITATHKVFINEVKNKTFREGLVLPHYRIAY